MKQTAVDFLLTSIISRIDLTTLKYYDEIEVFVIEAKKLEKQQIALAHMKGIATSENFDLYIATQDGIKYYNDTYDK